jgi:hypothetical protein
MCDSLLDVIKPIDLLEIDENAEDEIANTMK